MNCAICGWRFDGQPLSWASYNFEPERRSARSDLIDHPLHTDAELAETKAAVDASARALAALFFLGMARQVAKA